MNSFARRSTAQRPQGESPNIGGFNDGLFAALQADGEGFEKLSAYLFQKAGINLPKTDKNLSLMASRLAYVLQMFGLSNYRELYKSLIGGDEKIEEEFISALTTNTTHWFREEAHFSILQNLIPKILARKQKDHEQPEVKIWCAAASTGQEVYTLALVLAEIRGSANWKFRILGSDIDLSVLQKAASGCYLANEMRGLSTERVDRFFEPMRNSRGVYYRVSNELSEAVTFAKLNLVEPQYPFKGKFDVIFCRNVFIYFDRDTIHAIVENMANYLAPGGILFLGHAEAGAMRSSRYKTIHHAVYERK